MAITLFIDKKKTAPRTYFTLTDPDTGEEESHWLELRTALTDMEERAVKGGMVGRATVVGDELELRLEPGGDARKAMEIWINNWSFTDARGKPVNADRHHIELLPPWIFDVVVGVVTKHADAYESERSAKRFTEDAPDHDPLDTSLAESDA